MNDLKTDQREKVIDYVANQLQKLYFAYDQEIEIDKFNKTLKFIISEIETLDKERADLLKQLKKMLA